MRVLAVSWEYPPTMYGGLGRHVDALSQAQVRAGDDVVVLTQAAAGTPVVSPGGPGQPRVVRFVGEPGGPDVYRDTAAFVQLLQAGLVEAYEGHLSGWAPHVIHGHDWVVAQALDTLGERTGAPVVATVHATETGLYQGHVDTPFSRWRHGIEQHLVRQAQRTIVCSAAMAREVTAGLGAEHARVRVVPNGVDAERWVTTRDQRRRARESLGVDGRPLLVLVGRLEHEKGAQDAVEALRLLSRRHPDAVLVLVGEGARHHDLGAQAAAAGLGERVRLVGRLADDAVAALVASADVALVPSRYEPFGLVALEAMAAGTAVVASATGGLSEIVEDGVSGLVVPPADPQALADAVGVLIEHPSRADALREAAVQRARRDFGWGSVAARTRAVYSEVLP